MLNYSIYELQSDGTETLVRTGTVESFSEFTKLAKNNNYKIGLLKNPKFGYKWIFQNGKFKMF